MDTRATEAAGDMKYNTYMNVNNENNVKTYIYIYDITEHEGR